jgi:PadR family transcriptional regulator, regulatory protein PadR
MKSGKSPQTELLKGTLDLLILKTLELEPRHGVAVADRIEQISRGTFTVKPGSLFPALHRLEDEGFIAGEWGQTGEGRRAKAYRLTPAGLKQLSVERRTWARIVAAIGLVLEAD